MDTDEEVGDRKYNDGKVVNTLRKFTAEEKAYMEQYDEWKKRYVDGELVKFNIEF